MRSSVISVSVFVPGYEEKKKTRKQLRQQLTFICLLDDSEFKSCKKKNIKKNSIFNFKMQEQKKNTEKSVKFLKGNNFAA